MKLQSNRLLAIALAVLLLVGLLPVPIASADAPDPIKASEVLATAASLLGVPYVYGGNDPASGLDCSAYVSRAWHVGRYTTDTLHEVGYEINKDDLMPGDALNYSAPGDEGHVRLFHMWATEDRALMWVYDGTEPAAMHHVVPWDPRYVPLRRVNIELDVAMPEPPPLPDDIWAPVPPPPINVGTGVLGGMVVNAQTGDPVASARFFFWTAAEQYSQKSVVTDADGGFTVFDLPAGTYEVAAYAAGHDIAMDGKVIVNANRTTIVLMQIEPTAGAFATTNYTTGTSTVSGGDDLEAIEAAPDSLPLDYSIDDGHFYTQTSGRDGVTGFAVTNKDNIRFWDEFQRLGGVEGVGYPISRRFEWQGFTVQVMQKGVLQWRPDVGQAWLTNVFDELHDAGLDGWLSDERFTPRPLDPSFDHGKEWGQVVQDRLALLLTNPAIAALYDSVADPMTFFGLPTSEVVDNGSHYAIRLQRAVIQQWKDDVPWAAAGQVTVANGGDVAKEANLFPASATHPERSPRLAD